MVQTLPSDRESPLPPAAPSSGHMCSKKEDAVVLSGAEAGENQKEQRVMERSRESTDRCCLGCINVVRVLTEGCWLCGVTTWHPSLRRHERNKSLGSGCYQLFAHWVKNPILGQHFGDPEGTAIRPCPDCLAVLDSGLDRTELQRAPTY